MNMHQEFEEEVGGSIFSSLPGIIWQRRWWLIIPLVLFAVAGATAAYLLPAEYESSALVLIESQQLPDDNNYNSRQSDDDIQQRIARAQQRVLSRQDLIRLIRTNNLYPEEQKRAPLSEIVKKMRDDTQIAAIGTDQGPVNPLRGQSTIAVRIAYKYSDPVKAQIIAQQFVNRFLEVDASAQAEQATGAATFLNEQANSLQAQIAAINAQENKLKEQYGPVLALSDQSTGDPAADAARIDSQIAGLQADMAHASTTTNDSGVQAAEQQLRTLQARFSDTHPDVIAAKAQLEAAKRAAAADKGGVSAQVASDRAQIESLRAAKGMLLSQSSSLRSAQAQGPAIKAQIDQLDKQADQLREQYRIIGNSLQQAQMSARMETEQKGERLTLADPPVVPDHPVSPNRPMLVAGAVGAGLALGLALIFGLELLLRPIRGTDALKIAAGEPPLTVIPDYDKRPHVVIRWLERRNRRKAARA